MSEAYTPRANVAKELSEIATDFTRPLELVREAISNALDAQASEIWIEVVIDEDDDLVVTVTDDGTGMDDLSIRGFFDLGFSKKRADPTKIGNKGHGTKITYNSKSIEVLSRSFEDEDGVVWKATMADPLRTILRSLREEEDPQPPPVHLEKLDAKAVRELKTDHGTCVRVRGYDQNKSQKDFAHGPLKDYIQWFTAWGRVNAVAGHCLTPACVLHLKGLGVASFEKVEFGHPFPVPEYDFEALKAKDPRRPEGYFVRRWMQEGIPLPDRPGKTIDVYFSVEGGRARQEHNPMVKRRGKVAASDPYKGHRYGVVERYGIYVCKDHIPVQRKNERFSQTSAWTRWHAFINSQDFQLTANRGSVDNTPSDLQESIYSAAEAYIEEYVLGSDEYEAFAELQRMEEGRRKADKEKRELKKRKTLVEKKRRVVLQREGRSLTFLVPRNEQEVTWLLAQLDAVWPGLFPWLRVVDHDARFGYDMLVERENEASGAIDSLFVELKHELKDGQDFNHSFSTLWMIVCWKSHLVSGSIEDIAGKRRTVQKRSVGTDSSPRYFLEAASGTPIEIVSLENFLRDNFSWTEQ